MKTTKVNGKSFSLILGLLWLAMGVHGQATAPTKPIDAVPVSAQSQNAKEGNIKSASSNGTTQKEASAKRRQVNKERQVRAKEQGEAARMRMKSRMKVRRVARISKSSESIDASRKKAEADKVPSGDGKAATPAQVN